MKDCGGGGTRAQGRDQGHHTGNVKETEEEHVRHPAHILAVGAAVSGENASHHAHVLVLGTETERTKEKSAGSVLDPFLLHRPLRLQVQIMNTGGIITNTRKRSTGSGVGIARRRKGRKKRKKRRCDFIMLMEYHSPVEFLIFVCIRVYV